MIYKIAELLRDEISSLNFVDIAAGLAKPHTIRNNTTQPDDDEPTVEDVIVPMAYNDPGGTCERGELYTLYPNTKKKSIVWWEDNGIDMIEEETYYYQCRASLLCVAWFNLPLINSTYRNSNLLTANIIAAIPERLPNIDYISQIRVSFEGELPEGADVVGKYTFNDAENQFATYPFAVVGLNFAVDFAFGKNCVDTVNLAPSPCPPNMVIEELLDFDGVDDYVLLSALEDGVYGESVIEFDIYIPSGQDLFNNSQVALGLTDATFSDGILVYIYASVGNVDPVMAVIGRTIPPSIINVSLDGLFDIKLHVKVNKTEGSITNVIVNGVSHTTAGAAGILGTSQRYIGCRNGSDSFFKGCIWNIKVDDEALWYGYPEGNTNTAWEDQVGSNDGTVNGSPTTKNL